MTDLNTRPFGQSRIYKGLYGLAAILFSLLCAYRVALIIRPEPGKALIGLLFAVALAVLALLPGLICGKSESGRAGLHALTAAFFCVYSMGLYIEAYRSLIWLIIYALMAFFAGYALKRESGKNVRLAALGLGLLFAAFVFVGAQLENHGRLEILYIQGETALRLLFSFAAQALMFALALNTVFQEILERDYSGRRQEKPGVKRSLLSIGLLTLGIALFYLPYYYACYPGNLSPDSLYELRMQLGIDPVSNHHPYVHQLIIRLAMWLGGSSLELGVGIYSLIQIFALALAFALCVHFLGRMGVNRYIQIAVFCFFALFSVNGFYSVTMWKDVFYGAVSLGFMMLLVMAVREGKGAKLPLIAALGLFGFLFCIFRNNGWYAFLLGFPFFIICNRKNWKRLTAVFLAVVLLVCGYNHIIFNILGLRKSATGEALSVPLQQIARTVSQNPDVLKDEEYKDLREIFAEPDALGDIYISYISDPVKNGSTFLVDVFDEDPVKYLKSWAKLGLRHPVAYVEAFLLQCYGYWYPDVTYWIVHNDIEDNELGLDLKSERSGTHFALSILTRDISQSQPTAILYSLGLMVWLMMIAAALLILKGQGKYASPIFILAGLWLTTLASPVYCEYRYMYGFVTCVPLFLGLALGLKNRSRAEN